MSRPDMKELNEAWKIIEEKTVYCRVAQVVDGIAMVTSTNGMPTENWTVK